MQWYSNYWGKSCTKRGGGEGCRFVASKKHPQKQN